LSGAFAVEYGQSRDHPAVSRFNPESAPTGLFRAAAMAYLGDENV
jgi:hypothetical protein